VSDDTTPESRGDRLGTAVVRAAGLSLRLGRLVARAAGVGLLVAVAVLADPERRARLRRWFLLDGDRWLIAGAGAAVVFLVTLLLGLTDVVGVTQPGFVTSMLGGVISGLFSFVPIVVTVNQLTVSQVVGSPDELRSEIHSVDRFRSEIEAMHPEETVSSTEPASFLATAIEVVADHADCLEAELERPGVDPAAAEAVEAYLAVIREQSRHVEQRLDDAHLRLIELLVPMMGDSYSRNLNDARQLRHEFGDGLTQRAGVLLEELEQVFVELDVLRQYFKSLYVQQELSYLSRMVGYVGVGSFLISVFTVMLFANGQPLSAHPLLLDLLVSLVIATATLPFTVLVSFVVRVATIAQRTAASGAFTPRRETPEHSTHR
jgi:hypothetical protein